MLKDKVGLKVTLHCCFVSLCIGVFLVLGSSSILWAQDKSVSYCYVAPVCTLDNSCLTGTPVRLDSLWRYNLTASTTPDRTTTSDNFESYSFLANPTNTFEGNIFYVLSEGRTFNSPPAPLIGTTPLKRWFKPQTSTQPDHKDSVVTEVFPYGPDLIPGGGIVGHAWSSQVAGLGVVEQLQQASNVLTGDFATLRPSESIPPNYTTTAMGVYGWPRNNNTTDENALVTAQVWYTPLKYLTIGSNPNAGGALWLWRDSRINLGDPLGPTQNNLINNADYGRQIQAALFWFPVSASTYTDCSNPTEAGDAYSGNCCPTASCPPSPPCPAWCNQVGQQCTLPPICTPGHPAFIRGLPPCDPATGQTLAYPGMRNGSPMYQAIQTIDLGMTYPSFVQKTRAIPLEFDPSGLTDFATAPSGYILSGPNWGGRTQPPDPAARHGAGQGHHHQLPKHGSGRPIQYDHDAAQAGGSEEQPGFSPAGAGRLPARGLQPSVHV